MPPKKIPVLKLRGRLEDAGWQAREAVLAVEEGVVWRGTDAARGLAGRAGASRAGQAAGRARRALERRFTWPLADALRDSGEAARTGIATAAVISALAAATGGAMLAAGEAERSATAGVTPVAGAHAPVVSSEAPGETLEGVTPNFVSSQGGSDAAPKEVPVPRDPLRRTAWEFAQAFVLYEVGRADDAAEDFARLATPPLVKALAESPPRLPDDVKVPKARVLNVVPGEADGKRIEVSVSLVRLQAVSELRLTLKRSGDGWLVTEVRG